MQWVKFGGLAIAAAVIIGVNAGLADPIARSGVLSVVAVGGLVAYCCLVTWPYKPLAVPEKTGSVQGFWTTPLELCLRIKGKLPEMSNSDEAKLTRKNELAEFDTRLQKVDEFARYALSVDGVAAPSTAALRAESERLTLSLANQEDANEHLAKMLATARAEIQQMHAHALQQQSSAPAHETAPKRLTQREVLDNEHLDAHSTNTIGVCDECKKPQNGRGRRLVRYKNCMVASNAPLEDRDVCVTPHGEHSFNVCEKDARAKGGVRADMDADMDSAKHRSGSEAAVRT